MPTVTEARKRLRGVEGHVAVAIWCRDDVIGWAKEQRDEVITPEQADEILDEMDRRHDCELGMNWQTIDCYLDDPPWKRCKGCRMPAENCICQRKE